jgi:FKBP-type peptidyl-prolyl cis-trans isomerase
MKTMKNLLKISTVIVFAIFMASCMKNEDPYADYTPEREATLINDWKTAMIAKGQELNNLPNGIMYILDKTKTGSGQTIAEFATEHEKVNLTVKYTGMFLDGQIFDSSSLRGDGTMVYTHKVDRMISGWEEGIEVLKKGGSAAFLIPSAKAYGATGQGMIPPNTPLIFIIEVVDIK